jgi:hypothetical protein
MGVPGEHTRGDVSCQLADRFFAHGRVLGDLRDEGVTRIIEPIVHTRLEAGGTVGALVAIGCHRSVEIDGPQMWLPFIAAKADVMEGKDVGIRPGVWEA